MGEQEQFDQHYEEAMQHEQHLYHAESFLQSEGYIVIPPHKIKEFMGAYDILPRKQPDREINDDDIPF